MAKRRKVLEEIRIGRCGAQHLLHVRTSDPDGTRRQRPQFGDPAPIDGDMKRLSALYATEHGASVITEISRRHVVLHAQTVALVCADFGGRCAQTVAR